ncbi:MAG: hypothetical protein ACOCY7_00675 [Halodesulfurarchaeum sp.]
MGTFFGKAFPAPPAQIKPEDFYDAKQHYGPTALAFGADGRRFTDESSGTLVQDIASTPAGVGYYVLDSALYHAQFDGKHVGTAVEAAERGGSGRSGRHARRPGIDAVRVGRPREECDSDRRDVQRSDQNRPGPDARSASGK